MASKRRLRRKSCTGKKRYKSSGAAYRAIIKIRTGGGDPYKRLIVYKCSFCKKYHVGHQKIKHARRRKW